MADQLATNLGLRLAVSLLSAGVFYTVWMAAFILTGARAGAWWRAALWLAAPAVTAAGFAAGLSLFGRRGVPVRVTFARAYVAPCIGCSLGAAIVFPFGPMLIVFGMFAAGTLAVVGREYVASRRARQSDS